MKNTIAKIILLGWGLLLMGCATTAKQTSSEAQEKVLKAEGYGRFSDTMQLKQRWLNTQQIAKLNAYRGLAEQLYDEPLDDHQTVGSKVISNEAYRLYLDNFLREARTSDYRTVKDTLKVSMTLALTPKFYQCMSGDQFQIQRCLREDHKMDFSRLGHQPAITKSVNLACSRRDCSDQFHVKGFTHETHAINDALLDKGLYDMQWMANTSARLLFNHLLIDIFYNAL